MARIKPQALLQQSKKKKGPTQTGVTTLVLYGVVLVVMVFFLFATYRHWSQGSTIRKDDSLSVMESMLRNRTYRLRQWFYSFPLISALDDKAFSNLKKLEIPKYAIINTSKGFITVELYKEGSSSEVVADFIFACKKGTFKGMLFNRVIKNFVIQGGDVERADATDDWTSRGKHYTQLDTSLKHEAFMLGTSKAKDETAGFDLFITTAPIPDLNEKINVFGRVIKGEDVVQEIEEVDTDDHYKPKAPIAIIDVVLRQKV